MPRAARQPSPTGIRLLIALPAAMILCLASPASAAPSLTTDMSGTEMTPAAPEKPADFRYPSIRLEVAEMDLTAPLRATKDELVENSQVLEDALHNGGAVYNDPELQRVMEDLIPTDRLGEKSKGFYYRIYVLKDPTVNAMTTPTGSIYVNSGILAAMENFDQLRLVLAHEVHHIVDQDVVYRYKKFKDEVGAIRFAQLVAAPIIAVAIGESNSDVARTIAWAYTGTNLAISISYQLAFLGYGRENENECDLFALKLFDNNEYDLESAKRVFMLFEDEHERYGKGFRSHLFSDHETGKQRVEKVEKFMNEVERRPAEGSGRSDPRYHQLTHEVRIENARLNVKVRRPQHAIDDLDELAAFFPDDARIPCLLGQAYAMASEDPAVLREELSGSAWKKLGIKDEKKQKKIWSDKARKYYFQALKVNPSYAEPHKELALLKEARGNLVIAARHLAKYLELNPQGKDIRYVSARLDKLRRLIAQKKEERLNKQNKPQRNDNYRSSNDKKNKR